MACAYKSPLAGLSVHFSPFDPSILAQTSAQNFGIAGAGKLSLFRLTPQGRFEIVADLNERDAIFDCAFSEHSQHHIFTAGGKGTIGVWNLQTRQQENQIFAHRGEVQSVHANHKNQNLLLSSGSDGFVKIFDIFTKKELEAFPAHQGIGYQASWHPKNPNCFASVGQDGFLKLFDLSVQQKNIMSFRCHEQEILCCDFNKYQEQIVTGSIDKTVKIWDLRQLNMPVTTLHNHRYPVRKVKCSPFEANIVASASYDMNVNIWDVNHQQQLLVAQHKKHTEFVISLDFSLFQQRMIASTGYDGRLLAWNWDQPQPEIM